jgi:hypothetical protein
MVNFAELKNNRKAQAENLAKQLQAQNTKQNYDDDTYWQPTVDKAGNGLAIIRFLPPPPNEEDALIRYWEHGFNVVHGDKKRWYIEKCLTTLGQDDPVVEMNNQLYESGDKENIQLAKDRKRKLYYVANILVIDDKGAPENNGKVFRFKFGKKIYDKINEMLHPTFEDDAPINVFDMWEGCNFRLIIRRVEGNRNYDQSVFVKPPTSISDDDDVLEKIWKSSHSLQSEIAPEKFKSYDELKKRLEYVLGTSQPKKSSNIDAPKTTTNKLINKNVNQVPWDDDDDENNEKENTSSSNNDNDEEEDDNEMSFFKKMAKRK